MFHDLAARVGTASDEHEYGDNKAVWLEDGNRVLDYVEDERFSAASFKDSLEEQGVVINKNELTTLFGACEEFPTAACQKCPTLLCSAGSPELKER